MHRYKKKAFKACKITETQLAHCVHKYHLEADSNMYEFQGSFTPHLLSRMVLRIY